MFQIDLSTSGEFQLILPTGRSLEISATPTGVEYIKKIILDHRKNLRPKNGGYIGTFPTQHAVEKFLKEKAAQIKLEEKEQQRVRAKGLGIDLDKVEINL